MSNEEFKAAFLTAIRTGGAERERAFVFFETRLAESFKGEEGLDFYSDFLKLVEEADAAALPEAKKRFFPLIDQKLFGKKLAGAFINALPGYVESKERELGEKEAMVTFIQAMEKCSGAELGLLVEGTIANSTPGQLKAIMVLLALAVKAKKTV
jgi:hypothetical protein